MPRYWVIAPYHADRPELWEKVWNYDVEHSIISLGWSELGDISSVSENQLSELIDRTYTDKTRVAKSLYRGMLWHFYHSIKLGDVVIARRGLRQIAAIGDVARVGYYEHNKNSEALGPERAHSNYLDVHWREGSRNKVFNAQVFGRLALYEIQEEKFRDLTQAEIAIPGSLAAPQQEVQNQTEFVLEKYLEDVIVSNFDRIFKGELRLYSEPSEDADPGEGVLGQQFETHDAGTIDILAQETKSNAFVVIELKKGRGADKVVGQVLSYMGWVAENLCQHGEDVKGMIICKEPDPRLSYALRMAKNVSVKYYRVDFTLQDQP